MRWCLARSSEAAIAFHCRPYERVTRLHHRFVSPLRSRRLVPRADGDEAQDRQEILIQQRREHVALVADPHTAARDPIEHQYRSDVVDKPVCAVVPRLEHVKALGARSGVEVANDAFQSEGRGAGWKRVSLHPGAQPRQRRAEAARALGGIENVAARGAVERALEERAGILVHQFDAGARRRRVGIGLCGNLGRGRSSRG